MPISIIWRKQAHLQFSSVQTALLQTFHFKSLGGRLSSSNNARLTHIHPASCVNTMRHLSGTPNLQIFAKLTSFISKLAVEPDAPEKPADHRLVGRVDPKLETRHQEILESSGSFLEGYDKDLSALVKQVKSPPKDATMKSLIRMAKRTYRKKDKAQKTKERLRFFNFDKLRRPVVTSQFKYMYQLLQSVDVPCEELQYFPDIQKMTKDDIVMCIQRLNSIGIQKVFSLFLIQRIFAEMKIGISTTKHAKMRDGRTPVIHLSQVRLYLNLCDMLQQPDLDIVSLLDRLTEANGYESMATLHTKVKKLKSVGATSEVIWNNLELLTMSKEVFDKKIKLYRRSLPGADTPFPVALFLNKSFIAFQERLNVGQDVLDISAMLDISTEEFQVCWAFKKLNLPDLVQKVRMCLKVGIPKKDVFNNLSILNNVPMEKCYEVTNSFRESGLPVSIFIFKEMDRANGMNGGQGLYTTLDSESGLDERLQGGHDEETVGSASDWASKSHPGDFGGSNQVNSTSSTPVQSTSKKITRIKKRISKLDNSLLDVSHTHDSITSELSLDGDSEKKEPKRVSNYNSVESSKRSRRVLFHLVSHLLSLEPHALSRMFQCSLSAANVHRLDVTRNLDFLLSPTGVVEGGFTVAEVAKCPLVLVHPHECLKVVAAGAEEMVDAYLASSSSSPESLLSTPLSSSASSSLASWDDFCDDDVEEEEGEEEDEDACTRTSHSLFYAKTNSLKHSFPSSPASFWPSASNPYQSNPGTWASESVNTTTSLGNSLNSKTASDRKAPAAMKSIKHALFSCRVRHLHLLQYLLERDSFFSLGVAGSHVSSGFLNRPL